MTVAVDLGSGTVKVATDAGATIRLVPPVDPDLPHVWAPPLP